MDNNSSNKPQKAQNKSAKTWMIWKQRRYVVAILSFFGLFNAYSLRSNLSIAVVAMTERKEAISANGTLVSLEPEFDWDSVLQGYILSSFFYGYMTTQFLGGWVAARIGGKRVFGWGICITALLSLVTPALVHVNVYMLIAVRVIQGVCEGVSYPCIHAMMSKWAPPLERSRLVTIAFSGSYVGTVFSMPVSAALAGSLGWPSIFYFFGALGVLWFLLWYVTISDSPQDDKWISAEEQRHIQDSLGDGAVKEIVHPWRQIFTSMPVWALVVAHFCDNWGFYTMLTQLPKFMKDTLNYNLAKTGFMSALPYLVMAIMIQVSGQVADYLRSNTLTTGQVRKLFNTAGFATHIVFMLGAAFWLEEAGTIFCLVMAVGVGVIAWSGFGVNYLDIAPDHAGVLMGISNTFATIAGIVSPIVTGYVVVTPTKEEWQIIFCLACVIYFVGGLFYLFFSSGDLQPWAAGEEKMQLPQLTRDEHVAVIKIKKLTNL